MRQIDSGVTIAAIRYGFAGLLVICLVYLSGNGNADTATAGFLTTTLGVIIGVLFGQGSVQSAAKETANNVEKRINGHLDKVSPDVEGH